MHFWCPTDVNRMNNPKGYVNHLRNFLLQINSLRFTVCKINNL